MLELGTGGKGSGLWHTPTAQGASPSYEKRYPGKKERRYPIPNLAAEVQEGIPYSVSSKMREVLPTPQHGDYKAHNPKILNSIKRHKEKGVNKQIQLRDHVKMFPTPRVSDTEGGIVKNVELKDGSFSRKNKDGVRWGVKLKDAVDHIQMFPTPDTMIATGGEYQDIEKIKARKEKGRQLALGDEIKLRDALKMERNMFPTPTTMEVDHKDIILTSKGRRKHKDPNSKYPDHGLNLADTVKTEKGSLNPRWVSWLMGYPLNWLDIGTENPKTPQE